MEDFAGLRGRAEAIIEEIRNAEIRYGRPAGSVRLLAAAKYALPEELVFLKDSFGIADFGENTVQTYRRHLASLPSADGVRMHFIGSLQTNKVKYIADSVEMIHSVDSAKLAREIGKRAGAAGRTVKVLIEINSGREPDKGACCPKTPKNSLRNAGRSGG